MSNDKQDSELIIDQDQFVRDLLASAPPFVGGVLSASSSFVQSTMWDDSNSLNMGVMPQIKGPVGHGMDTPEYWRKLAGIDLAPPSREEQEHSRLSVLTEDEIVRFANDLTRGVTHYRYIHLLNDELAARGLATVDIRAKHNIGVEIKKGACCDGDMFHFGNGAEVCVAPPSFTEIEELHGATICINKAPASNQLPKELRIIGGGVEGTYFNRKAIPSWLHSLIRDDIKDTVETRETRKQLWEQMYKAVSKRPRKKKDGTSRSAMNELWKKTPEDKERVAKLKRSIKKSIARGQPAKPMQPVDLGELQAMVSEEIHK